mmetsp:Transcript_68162/g.142422  ORF Transcript_68162/g.142422 Transcript_68162/m.142422 type:complete len:449 (-) Transcript_68162:330-1676(-)
MPLRSSDVTFQHDQNRIPIHCRDALRQDDNLDVGHDRDRQEHPCRTPDQPEESHTQQSDNWVHLHRGVVFDQLHLNDVGEHELQGKLRCCGHHKCQDRGFQAAVEENDRYWQSHGKKGPNLGDKAQKHGQQPKQRCDLHVQGMQKDSHADSIAQACRPLQEEIPPKYLLRLPIQGHWSTKPEHCVKRQHQQFEQNLPCVLQENPHELRQDELCLGQHVLGNLIHHTLWKRFKDVCRDPFALLHSVSGSPFVNSEVLLETHRPIQEEHRHAKDPAGDQCQCCRNCKNSGKGFATATAQALHVIVQGWPRIASRQRRQSRPPAGPGQRLILVVVVRVPLVFGVEGLRRHGCTEGGNAGAAVGLEVKLDLSVLQRTPASLWLARDARRAPTNQVAASQAHPLEEVRHWLQADNDEERPHEGFDDFPQGHHQEDAACESDAQHAEETHPLPE